MSPSLEKELRKKEYLLKDLFDIKEHITDTEQCEDCFIIKDGIAKFYNNHNNNMMPSRYEFSVIPKYNLWQDPPERLNIMMYQKVMHMMCDLVTEGIKEHMTSSPMVPSYRDILVFQQIKIQIISGMVDQDKIDTIHMANLYQKHM